MNDHSLFVKRHKTIQMYIRINSRDRRHSARVPNECTQGSAAKTLNAFTQACDRLRVLNAFGAGNALRA